MAAGDILPNGNIELTPGTLYGFSVPRGIVWIHVDKMDEAKRHGWEFNGVRYNDLIQVRRQ